MRVGIGLGLCFGVAFVSGLHAQSTADFGRLEPGQVVRVSTVGKSRFVTRLGGVPRDPTVELFAHAEVPVDVARVDSLWVRGHATWTGAIVGAAVLTPLGFLGWGVLCEAADDDGCASWGLVAGLAMGTGAAGALLGAGVGALIPKWRLRYARARDITVTPLLAPGRIGVAVRF
ncbi:MAG: hypothetical protein OEY20_03510 [Gemmatimonadota bacterium]|nr:hypothetical protein [Gemmatimonadota bacterium]MDH4351678.1 hypothetical protein [Gemmatimonadota bacterium]MDH5196304.1 hypothetical protein [Gemmatimonadota bacterium]